MEKGRRRSVLIRSQRMVRANRNCCAANRLGRNVFGFVIKLSTIDNMLADLVSGYPMKTDTVIVRLVILTSVKADRLRWLSIQDVPLANSPFVIVLELYRGATTKPKVRVLSISFLDFVPSQSLAISKSPRLNSVPFFVEFQR